MTKRTGRSRVTVGLFERERLPVVLAAGLTRASQWGLWGKGSSRLGPC